MSSTETLAGERSAIGEGLARRSHLDVFKACPRVVRQALGWRCEEVGGAVASIASKSTSVLMNRTMDLGTFEPAEPDQVAEIARRYGEAGVGRYFVTVSPHARPPEIRDWLMKQGLVAQRRWMKFERDMRPAEPARSTLRVARIDARDALESGRIIAHGFDMGEAAAGMFPPLVGRAGWHLFGAFDGDALAGAGVLYVEGRFGYFPFGATAPAHRKKGAQSALLAARIEAARALGCDALFTETGEEVPGDPQHSYHNIERAGFEPSYLVENYAPPR
jgi:GNAT superfamily N-acetyltransferase